MVHYAKMSVQFMHKRGKRRKRRKERKGKERKRTIGCLGQHLDLALLSHNHDILGRRSIKGKA